MLSNIYGNNDCEQDVLDYFTLNKYKLLKQEYINIIKESKDKSLVMKTKLQLKLLEKKFKGVI